MSSRSRRTRWMFSRDEIANRWRFSSSIVVTRSLEALNELLVRAAEGGTERVAIVGGAVRDLALGSDPDELGTEPRDYDIVLEGDALAWARRNAALLDSRVVAAHEAFGTAELEVELVELDPEDPQHERFRIDVASARTETYAEPGALPAVQLGATIEQDLGRRDFTIHAMALPLTGRGAGTLLDPHGGYEDLAAGLLRVLHSRSFIDDPTRILRAVRYAARFGLELDQETADWLDEALEDGALATVTPPRIGNEFELLVEQCPVAGARLLEQWGVAEALLPQMRLTQLAGSAHPQVQWEESGDPWIISCGAMLAGTDPVAAEAWLREIDVRGPRVRGVRQVLEAYERMDELRAAERSSLEQLVRLLAAMPLEARIVVASSLSQLGPEASDRLSFAGTLVTGRDLLERGVPEGPLLGEALGELRVLAALDPLLDQDLERGDLAAARERTLSRLDEVMRRVGTVD